jgi:hypothetical protein
LRIRNVALATGSGENKRKYGTMSFIVRPSKTKLDYAQFQTCHLGYCIILERKNFRRMPETSVLAVARTGLFQATWLSFMLIIHLLVKNGLTEY